MSQETIEEQLKQKLAEQAKVKMELEKVNVELDKLTEQEDALDKKAYQLKAEIRKLQQDNFVEGFDQWKSQHEDEIHKIKPYQFKLTKEQTLKAKYLHSLNSKPSGASGGGTTYEFTPTGIGDVAEVIIKGTKYDITDYDEF